MVRTSPAKRLRIGHHPISDGTELSEAGWQRRNSVEATIDTARKRKTNITRNLCRTMAAVSNVERGRSFHVIEWCAGPLVWKRLTHFDVRHCEWYDA